jgi:hypothetical protein
MAWFPPISDRLTRGRTPFGEVPISCVYGFDYPWADETANFDQEFDMRLRKHGSLKESVDNLVRTSRGMSENRLLDDSFLYAGTGLDNSYGGYWPMLREGTPIRSTLRARSLSPIRNVPITIGRPTRARSPPLPPLAATPRQTYGRNAPFLSDAARRRGLENVTPPAGRRTTSIGFSNGSNPWTSTGFYYSPRYPEAYRGTSSTCNPYANFRRYYDQDINNPNRSSDYFGKIKDYGYVPYKYSRRYV